MADCTARAISGVSCAMTSDTRRAASSELVVVVAGPTLLREPWLNPAEVRGQPCGSVWTWQCIYYYLPSTLLLSTPKPSCPDDKEDVESNLFPEAEDSEEKLCWLETEAVEEEEEVEEEAPTAAWTAWATCGWMASRICCTRLPLAREAWAWEEKEESREAARDEEELEEELEEEEEEELEEEEETDNSLVAFST